MKRCLSKDCGLSAHGKEIELFNSDIQMCRIFIIIHCLSCLSMFKNILRFTLKSVVMMDKTGIIKKVF